MKAHLNEDDSYIFYGEMTPRKPLKILGKAVTFKKDSIYKNQLQECWWTDSKPNGRGRWIDGVTNDIYVGDWVNGMRHGHGTYTWHHGGKYVGEWANNTRHGKGVWIYTNGSTREGTFKNGKEDGVSIATFEDGT